MFIKQMKELRPIFQLSQHDKEEVNQECFYQDFPKPGIKFFDIFKFLDKHFPQIDRYYCETPIVLMPEARGFLFYKLFKPNQVIPLRKSGKLPGDLLEIPTEKEYGSDMLYIQKDLLRKRITEYVKTHPHATIIPVTFFDDVAATGKTAECIINYFNNFNFEGYTFKVVYCTFCVELKGLGAFERLKDLCNVETFYTINL